MNLPILLVSIAALTTLALSASVSSESTEKPTESSVETFDSYAVRNLPEQLPLTIQLPREESGVPFYSAQPEPYLRAPQFIPNPQTNLYQAPIPSEYLTAPTEGGWNSNDDPSLYYELPASITKENVPTSHYPKKYNKDIHSKSKPLSTIPKQEIALEPINESQYIQKQKELYKTIQNLDKQENQKNIEKQKVPIRILRPRIKLQQSKTQPKDNVSHQTKLTKPRKVLPSVPFTTTTSRPPKRNNFKIPADSSNSETTFEQNSDNEPEHYDSNKFTRGLSPQITDSLGITSKRGAEKGQPERVHFHMVGHDGPMSYKWGYDTGKGHNRQFRFEERDKDGVVNGQFGYYDKDGKFRMMNYKSQPGHGFHMEPAPESEFEE